MKNSTSATKILSEKIILEAPGSDYMSTDQLEFFRQRLITLYNTTQAGIQGAKEKMSSPISESDPNDRASLEEQSGTALRVLGREQKTLTQNTAVSRTYS